ncbi:hypothetical protein LA5095_00618 [Roseibium album]|uniref:Uncharacterized protein n=1 Tax=Roseibium album TaxID=311410 RepID=A0A0M6ZVV9_9HYPH|nr:hypothetical protein LA5094_03352 [Roseibium album]CTQ65654.1 hypothetical protein LA5095_00618 [Roseibium album]CTQ73697.1 hypothetical protein LA5096_03758 [Roseibium album]
MGGDVFNQQEEMYAKARREFRYPVRSYCG